MSAEAFKSDYHRPHRLHQVPTQKEEATKELISSAIQSNVLFAGLQSIQISKVIDEMWSREVPAGDTLFEQGQDGDNFYVVESGTFNITTKNPNGMETLIAVRSTAESFGELALMYNTPRNATCRATTHSKVWAVDRVIFRKILIPVSEEKLKEYERFLCQVPLLSKLLFNAPNLSII